ncbi:hypothetical protein ACFL0U_02810 [Pseudomonadota bacterium]
MEDIQQEIAEIFGENLKHEERGKKIIIRNENNEEVGFVMSSKFPNGVLTKQIHRNSDNSDLHIMYKKDGNKLYNMSLTDRVWKIEVYNLCIRKYRCCFLFDDSSFVEKIQFVLIKGSPEETEELSIDEFDILTLQKLLCGFYKLVTESSSEVFETTYGGIVAFPMAIEKRMILARLPYSGKREIFFPDAIVPIYVNQSDMFGEIQEGLDSYRSLRRFVHEVLKREQSFIIPINNERAEHAVLLICEYFPSGKRRFTFIDSNGRGEDGFYTNISGEFVKTIIEFDKGRDSFVALRYKLQQSGKKHANCSEIRQEFALMFYRMMLRGESCFDLISTVNQIESKNAENSSGSERHVYLTLQDMDKRLKEKWGGGLGDWVLQDSIVPSPSRCILL